MQFKVYKALIVHLNLSSKVAFYRCQQIIYSEFVLPDFPSPLKQLGRQIAGHSVHSIPLKLARKLHGV